MKLCAMFERNRTIRGGVIAVWTLTLWPWTIITCSTRPMLCDSLHKVYTQSSYPCMKCDDFITLIRHVTLWPYLPLDLELLWSFGRRCVQTLCKIWAKSNNPLQSYWRVSTLSSWNCWEGRVSTKGSQGCVDRTSPNLVWTYVHHLCSPSLYQSWDILLHFQTRAAQSRAMLKTMPNFELFDPPSVKIRGGMSEISGSRFKAFTTTERRV